MARASDPKSNSWSPEAPAEHHRLTLLSIIFLHDVFM